MHEESLGPRSTLKGVPTERHNGQGRCWSKMYQDEPVELSGTLVCESPRGLKNEVLGADGDGVYILVCIAP